MPHAPDPTPHSFEEAGYDDAVYLYSMNEKQMDQLGRDCKMKTGHIAKYKDMLRIERERRLRASTALRKRALSAKNSIALQD